MTEEHRPIPDILKDLAEALNHIENNRLLIYGDLAEGDGYETLEYLQNMKTWIQDAKRLHLALSREEQGLSSAEKVPPPCLHLPSQVDLAGFLRCIADAAETGYVTPRRVAEYVRGTEALSEEESLALERRVSEALSALCTLPILIRRSDIQAGFCPQCQRCNILTRDALPTGSLEGQVECVYCAGKRAIRFWRCMPCFSLMPVRAQERSPSEAQLLEERRPDSGAAIDALLHVLEEEHQIDQAMRWSFHQQGAMAPKNFPPDLVLSFLLAYASHLLKQGGELTQPRLGNVYIEDETVARHNAQQAAELYWHAYLLGAQGISVAEGQTWIFQH